MFHLDKKASIILVYGTWEGEPIQKRKQGRLWVPLRVQIELAYYKY